MSKPKNMPINIILKVNTNLSKLLKPNEDKILEVSLESIILNISFNKNNLGL